MRDFGIDDRHHTGAVRGHDGPGGDVTFSQVARLELDELLEQLVLRARDVQDAQGRLRGLLHAFLAVARADSLDVVLRHVVDAARELVDARYAALGVVRQGRLTQFVHAGMHADVVRSDGDGTPLLLGTVSQDIAVHATCPVLLIPTKLSHPCTSSSQSRNVGEA